MNALKPMDDGIGYGKVVSRLFRLFAEEENLCSVPIYLDMLMDRTAFVRSLQEWVCVCVCPAKIEA